MAAGTVDLHGEGVELFYNRKREVILEGVAGCVAGETELWDPIARRGRRIDELCWERVRPVVDTLLGPVRAFVPVLQGHAPLYRVTLESGASCLVTDEHRFLTPSGWRHVCALVTGDRLCASHSAREGLSPGWGSSHQSAPTGDALRCSGTAPSCTGDCQPHLRSCGEQPHRGAAVALAPGTSRAGAQVCSRSCARWDDQEQQRAHIRQCQRPAPHSSGGCLIHGLSTACVESRAFAHRRAPIHPTSPALSQWPEKTGPQQQAARHRRVLPDTHSSGSPLSWHRHTFSPSYQWSAIKSIRYERTDFYYDLHVPVVGHYLGDGFVSHNCGKSYLIGQFLLWCAEEWPGIRISIGRKTRASLSESFLTTWEEKVLDSDIPEHAALLAGPTRAHREKYTHPNGTVFVINGMDKQTKLFSAEYDIMYWNEVIELTEEDWELCHRALRNNRMPFQLLLGDTNPGAASHWANQRMLQGRTRRLIGRFSDNPALDPDYLKSLDENLSGVQRERLFKGRWVTAEGLIWESYDTRRHLVDMVRDVEFAGPDEHHRDENGELVFRGFFASIDWGFRKPGCFQVWGQSKDGSIYRIYEVYHAKWTVRRWAEEVINPAHKKWNLQAIVCDSAEPDSIWEVNRVLLELPEDAEAESVPGIAIMADKRWRVGRDLVDTKFEEGSIFLVRDATDPDHIDRSLVKRKKPWCTELELDAYVWRKPPPTKPEEEKEEPDPTCEDHGCDALRYAAMWGWGRDLDDGKPDPLPEGSIGQILGHDEVLDEMAC